MLQEREQLERALRARPRRRGVDDRLGEAGQEAQGLAELGVDVRVPGAEARDLLTRAVGVGPAAQGVAVRQRRERALERQDLQPVARQLEFADDPGPQQADDVGADRVGEAGVELLADRGPAQHGAALEHHHPAAGPRQVGRADEPVVPAAHHDRVDRPLFRHQLRFRSGSKKGRGTTRAPMRRRSCSTVASMASPLPGAAQAASTVARARYFFRVGEKARLVA